MPPLRNDAQTLLKQHCIAITGGIATGKSTVCQILKSQNYLVLDADQFARDVTLPGSPALEKIIQTFGPTILNQDQSLNRSALRDLVFKDESRRLQLESILHPAIDEALLTWVRQHAPFHQPFFYEASLIVERKRQQYFLQTWCTLCPEEIQLARLMSRSKLTQEEALGIIGAQMPAKAKAALSTVTIDTNRSFDSLTASIAQLLEGL